MNFVKKVILLLIFCFSIVKIPVLAQEVEIKSFEGKVSRIIEEKKIEIEGQSQLYQEIEIEISKGEEKGNKVVIENGQYPLANVVEYKKGDRVIISQEIDFEGNSFFIINDFIRRDSLLYLFLIFIVLTIIIARWRGLSSLLGMVFTFGVLMLFVLPQILKGVNPLLITVIAVVIIIPISFYLAHGINKKTTVSVIGSIVALLITTMLAFGFIGLGKLTGLSSEEAGMLMINQGNIDMRGLLLAGIMIGSLGILDDISISQAAIVEKLIKNSKNEIKKKEVYKEAMDIGRDHISSMVNTLVLAYAGASLPLLLIFTNSGHPFLEVINYEFLAEEIIRTLVGSIGLIMAVPITTLIAVNWIKKNK